MFDVPEAKTRQVSYHFDAPFDERDWNVGLIVGPSGAGKSSVARHLFGDDLIEGYEWDDKAVVDNFPKSMSIREVTKSLSSVGFSSPPSWTKPWHVLSNGEKFRANLARALVDSRDVVAFDEFTSVVDRTVGQIGAHAVAKQVRKSGKRFVAVTCHEDVLDWLQPDWVIEPHVGGFHWRSVQSRPPIEVVVHRVHDSAWQWFAPHHYLSAELSKGCRCFLGTIGGQPACFAALRNFPHPKLRDQQAISRVVALPDFQGIGLVAHHFTDLIASIAKANGKHALSRPAHPALINTRARSPNWQTIRVPKFSSAKGARGKIGPKATRRRIASFRYVGPPHPDKALACKLWS
jgi:ABC-type lipoprotein export system ATPase subunit